MKYEQYQPGIPRSQYINLMHQYVQLKVSKLRLINRPVLNSLFATFGLNLTLRQFGRTAVQYPNPKPGDSADAEPDETPEKDFSHVREFFEIVNGIGCDRLSQLRLLFSLAEEFYKNPGDKGLTIAELAHRSSMSLEAARYGVRALRVEQLVTRASRLGRVEFFQLTPGAHEAMETCLRAFGIIAEQEAARARLRRTR